MSAQKSTSVVEHGSFKKIDQYLMHSLNAQNACNIDGVKRPLLAESCLSKSEKFAGMTDRNL
jgi:hypothetical protein